MASLRTCLRVITVLLGIIVIGRYLVGIPPIPEPFATILTFFLVMFSGAAILVDRKIKKEKQNKNITKA